MLFYIMGITTIYTSYTSTSWPNQYWYLSRLGAKVLLMATGDVPYRIQNSGVKEGRSHNSPRPGVEQ